MIWSNEFALEILPVLLRGLWVTVQLTLLGFLISLVVGLVVAVVRFAKIPVLSQLCTFYVLFMRGTPLLVQAYFAFYVLPAYGVTLSSFATGVVVIGLNYSAYTAEVYRSGIEGVATGQWEAATALSLPPRSTWNRVVLPQAVRSVIPVLGNYLIQMFKDSAVLSAIGVIDLMRAANTLGSSSFRYLEPFTLAGLLFLIISYTASIGVKRLEHRYAPAH
jgi:polar amino acid transport system permease protein